MLPLLADDLYTIQPSNLQLKRSRSEIVSRDTDQRLWVPRSWMTRNALPKNSKFPRLIFLKAKDIINIAMPACMLVSLLFKAKSADLTHFLLSSLRYYSWMHIDDISWPFSRDVFFGRESLSRFFFFPLSIAASSYPLLFDLARKKRKKHLELWSKRRRPKERKGTGRKWQEKNFDDAHSGVKTKLVLFAVRGFCLNPVVFTS